MPRSGIFLGRGWSTYHPNMHTAMRFLRVFLLLLVATAILGLMMALSTPATGLVEKVVLIGLIAACVYLASRVPTVVGRLEARLFRS